MKNKILLLAAALSTSAAVFAQSTCSTAQVITAGTYSFASVDGSEVPMPVCASGGTGATLGKWYKFNSQASVQVTVTTDFPDINGNIDNRVHIYNGTCGALNCVAGDDDSGTGYLCVVSFNALANVDYYIAFDNRWTTNNPNNGFTFELISTPMPPAPPVSFLTQNYPNITGTYKIAVADMNGDYLDDIVSVSGTEINILYQQTDGSFTQATFPTDQAQFEPSWSMAIGDYNKDGFNDLLYGGGSGVSFFYSNSTGTEYSQWFVSTYVFSQRSNFVDLNNDGHLDAFVCHDVAPNVYYMNDGSGNLTFNQGGIGDHPNGGNYGSIWIDYDNDGDQDLFIAKCRGGQGTAKLNELHRNNGNGTFTNVSVAANMNHPNQTWSSAWNDFDNDGDMDAVIGASTFTDGGHLFMRNNGDGTFTDITEGSGWDTYTGTAIEYVSYDFNNDGWADVLTNGRVFLNNGDNTFAVQNIQPSVGAIGDLNNDGFLDIQNGNTVYFSQPNGNNWIKMNLKGIESNSYAIGARVEIYGEWGKQIRDVQSGIGFRHMGTLNPHFGIGSSTAIDSVIVRWPSGKKDVICSPAINTTLYIEEGSGVLPVADFTVSDNDLLPGQTADFTDASTTLCPITWSWSVQPPMGWVYTNGTSASSQNPVIQFNNIGIYTVSLVVTNGNGSSTQNPSEQINVTSGLGLQEDLEQLFRIFPNPTSGELNLEFAGNLDGAQLSVLSTIGTEVMTFDAMPSTIDASNLSNGTYFLVLALPNGNKITKLFVKN
jgi:PKD repeat protein